MLNAIRRKFLKPIKRWMFAKGCMHTQLYSKRAFEKYIQKYIRKRTKLGLPPYSASETELIVGLKQHRVESRISPELQTYAVKLETAIASNVGLDHSKTREYWLLRGPRVLTTALVFISFSIGLKEILIVQTCQDRIHHVILSISAILVTIYMLYFRLPDSICSAIMRSAHDVYVCEKQKLQAQVR